MEEETYIIDPDGEVIIIVRNPNAPFAVWKDESAQAEKPAASGESLKYYPLVIS